MDLQVSQNVADDQINLYIAKRHASFSVPWFVLIFIGELNSFSSQQWMKNAI